MKLDHINPSRSAKKIDILMYIDKIIIDHNRFPTIDVYPFNLAILQNTEILKLKMRVTVFTGENDIGKFTLWKNSIALS